MEAILMNVKKVLHLPALLVLQTKMSNLLMRLCVFNCWGELPVVFVPNAEMTDGEGIKPSFIRFCHY